MSIFQLPSITKKKNRLGRGHGRNGGKSGRGQKGQKSRAGYSAKKGFEGGQTPLYMRFPKGRGVKQITPSQIKKPAVITLGVLRGFEAGSIVGPGQLHKRGYVQKKTDRVKLIGAGALEGAYTVRVHACTPGAKAAVEKSGGKVELIEIKNRD
ncbi:MAG: 50S ribosomal protein L15 [Candidatus Andersenbacteria bacterium RIFCSPHIGHO2_12_FULL_45_11b]|uniref:Large ribosomal subunit protein uL15 n=1 Tax=Candidatus Andersenbacteria bacterium RIFCSPHIGHO2_12_FULL_45_11b TaxID=1797282 RepID=A0A1G1X7Q3_9BACT|nr:MAG: 50S ribosomal protein L15 [Candidatus Andersenbacteria bacterium RIFCSPHIGHO2_12_FULL_45_11b]